MNSQHIVVLCSCADEASAARIAHALVAERLLPAAWKPKIEATPSPPRGPDVWSARPRDAVIAARVIVCI